MTDSEKLDLILSEMQGVKTGMQSMETRMQGMETKMQGMETRMQGMETGMQNMEDRMQTMENDLHEVKQKVTNIDLTLENEIRVNIKRVAEGHLDISRNLHDALKIDSEKEMIVIRVNILESELRRLKERLDQIA
ncbi:MAG: hypothetical protein K2M91_15210 [Lachnospiraceae bacterium]|nr:hypothetical protein [Lachnospiraceae bacterium]